MRDSSVIAEALAAYYRAHGLPPDGGASDPWFRAAIGPLSIRLPNPPARRRAVRLHDINHLATGYNTVFSEGEMAIAAFEVGAGCGGYFLVWLINLSMFALGLGIQPRAQWEAFIRGRHSTSVYHLDHEVAGLDELTIIDVRALLQLDSAPTTRRLMDAMSFLAWTVVAVTLWLTPLLVTAALWRSMR